MMRPSRGPKDRCGPGRSAYGDARCACAVGVARQETLPAPGRPCARARPGATTLRGGLDVTTSAARLITGKRTKYLIILFWLLIAAFAFPLAGQLTDAEKNDIKSWLPGAAESTKVLDFQASFANPNTIPAVIVYERPGGLTRADRVKVTADVRAYRTRPELDGKVVGPVRAADGR